MEYHTNYLLGFTPFSIFRDWWHRSLTAQVPIIILFKTIHFIAFYPSKVFVDYFYLYWASPYVFNDATRWFKITGIPKSDLMCEILLIWLYLTIIESRLIQLLKINFSFFKKGVRPGCALCFCLFLFAIKLLEPYALLGILCVDVESSGKKLGLHFYVSTWISQNVNVIE